MKNWFVAIAVIFAVSVTHAATLQWGFSEDSLLYVKNGDDFVSADQYTEDISSLKYVLVYLGTATTLSLDKVSESTIVGEMAYGLYEEDGAKTAYLDPFVAYFETTGSARAADGVTDITVSAGDNFGIAFFNGEKYDYIYATDGSSVGSALTGTASLSSVAATANPVAFELGKGGNIAVVVPEPSVALLGLLGLGMLLKRRKA